MTQLELLKEKRANGDKVIVFYIPFEMSGLPFHCMDLWKHCMAHMFTGNLHAVFVGEGPLDLAIEAAAAASETGDSCVFFFKGDDLVHILECGDTVVLSEGSLDFSYRLKVMEAAEKEVIAKMQSPPSGRVLHLEMLQVKAVGGFTFPASPVC